VLGVLYNLARDYPAAVAAFEAAIRLRPTDYSLWNKLGATQANSMECAKALPCYVNALELKPQYVRALSNLGISYSNMMSYDAAGSCYLKALSLNPEAKHIWSYLGMTLTSMGRPDLVEKVAGQNVEAFRADFDF
jgi:peroxin-5